MASTGDAECAVKVIKFCVSVGKTPAETMKLIRSSETIKSMQCVCRLQVDERFRNGRKSTEKDSRDGPPCVVKMTMKDITF